MAGTDNNRLLAEDIEQIKLFLNANLITEEDPQTVGWYKLMMMPDVAEALKSVLDQISPPLDADEPQYNSKEENSRVPAYDRVLRAFTLVPPELVQVVVIGSAPALCIGSLGGVAFSSPEQHITHRSAVLIFRQALQRARLGGELPTDSSNLEIWAADRNVLLLNAGLTMQNRGSPDGNGNVNTDTSDNIRYHCDLWENFMIQLLRAWRRENALNAVDDLMANLQINDADDEENDTGDEDNVAGDEENVAGDNRIHVLLLGYAAGQNPNYAERVWGTDVLPPRFNVTRCHHPTFPQENNSYTTRNNFIQNATRFFRLAFTNE